MNRNGKGGWEPGLRSSRPKGRGHKEKGWKELSLCKSFEGQGFLYVSQSQSLEVAKSEKNANCHFPTTLDPPCSRSQGFPMHKLLFSSSF